MSPFLLLFCLFLIRCLYAYDASYNFSFSNVYGNYMVLQQAPYQAQILGFSSVNNDTITIKLTNSDKNELIQTINTHAIYDNEFNAYIWKARFNPITASFSNFTITANSLLLNTVISLKNVLFGDVFICSGQSNMFKQVNYVINASQEIQDANNYPFIRVMASQIIVANEPQLELESIMLNWSIANNISIGGGPDLNGIYFSAVCWFFGRDLFQTLNYPLGLIETAYGGTSIYAWSSPYVLQECNATTNNAYTTASNRNVNDGSSLAAVNNSQLWNAMIYPFLSTTIKGAIWYQGEADSHQPHCNYYSCLLKSMINDWRLQWSLRSDTDELFPFGIVQLSVWNDEQNVTCGDSIPCTATAIVREAQTGNYGYLPNNEMLETFFATAIDLGDPNGTSDIHPRFKQQVGRRLADSALNIVYGQSDIYWFGPIASKAIYNKTDKSVVVNFRNVGEFGLEIKNFVGFEILDSNNHWIVVNESIVSMGNYDIVVSLPSSINTDVSNIRYNYYEAPCCPDDGILNCAIYDQQYQLPAIPFMLEIQ